MPEIGRMTDADGELLIFGTYPDGSAGASDGQVQRFRLDTPEQRDTFAQLLNATFLAAEREADRAQ